MRATDKASRSYASASPPDVRRRLCPAVEVYFHFGATPLVRPFSKEIRSANWNKGTAQGIIWLLTAGQSHRLTSGGTAEPNLAHNI